MISTAQAEAIDAAVACLPDVPHASEITIQALLNHTSGLVDYLGVSGVVPFLHSTTATPADLYGPERAHTDRRRLHRRAGATVLRQRTRLFSDAALKYGDLRTPVDANARIFKA